MAKAVYNHEKIENNWKDKWYGDNIYEAVDFSEKPKKYILAELPYPSGKSLHVGHMMRYTVPEIYSRYLRMRGYNVLFPMGWDCFGLPAETFAIKEGITPQEAIAQATKDYKKAMQDIGYGIDWSREITTSDPKYYKWTQWMFKKLWEEGLAVQKEMPVWWCEELGVLADEEVLPEPDGEGKISERGGYKVEKKMFKQWVLDIPAYAEDLIKDLDKTSYKENVKIGQINWIGKKEGATIIFDLEGNDLPVFTTRPDTIFGVTFIAISPTKGLIKDLLNSGKIKNSDEVKEYIENAKSLSDLEKQTKEKTGVLLDGVKAVHPVSGKDIPVFVADYIVEDYGEGSVMGVPAHDERDFEFAEKYNLEIIKVIESEDDLYTGHGKVINSDEYDGMNSEDFAKTITEKLTEEGKGKATVTYKLRPQVFSRQRYWGEPIPLVYKENGDLVAVEDDKLPIELPIMKDFLPSDDGTSPLERNTEWNNIKGGKRETDTMPTWAGSNWYYFRYIDPNNNDSPADIEKLKYWMPVDMYFGDAGHTTAHLLYSRFWYKFLYKIGVVPHDEPYDFRMSGGMLLGPDGNKMSKSKGNVINPQEVLENYGADAVRTYLAFIGPYEDTYPWNPQGLVACARLVKNIYEMKDKVKTDFENEETTKLANKMIKKMTSMMDDLKMNTSVSEIMIFVNHLKKQEKIGLEIWKLLIKVIAPYMPFTAEELWQEINEFENWEKENSVHLSEWPEFDEQLAKDEQIELPIQINGKLKVTITVDMDIDEQNVKELVENNEQLKTHLDGKEIKKFIFVPNRIVNIVV